jgi:hypothetical protein
LGCGWNSLPKRKGIIKMTQKTIKKTRILTAITVIAIMMLSLVPIAAAAPVWTEVSDFSQLKKSG